jgi:hypothetical protein
LVTAVRRGIVTGDFLAHLNISHCHITKILNYRVVVTRVVHEAFWWLKDSVCTLIEPVQVLSLLEIKGRELRSINFVLQLPLKHNVSRFEWATCKQPGTLNPGFAYFYITGIRHALRTSDQGK